MARRSIAMLLACAAATAPLAGANAADTHKGEGARSCFYSRDISSWSEVDSRTVNLRVSLHDYYQLKLLTDCPDVNWTQAIGLESRGRDWICSGADVTLIIPHPQSGPPRCPASEMRKLSREEVAALPARQKP